MLHPLIIAGRNPVGRRTWAQHYIHLHDYCVMLYHRVLYRNLYLNLIVNYQYPEGQRGKTLQGQ